MTEQLNNMLWRKGADGKWIYTSELSPMQNKSYPSNKVASSSSHNGTPSIEMYNPSLIKVYHKKLRNLRAIIHI